MQQHVLPIKPLKFNGWKPQIIQNGYPEILDLDTLNGWDAGSPKKWAW